MAVSSSLPPRTRTWVLQTAAVTSINSHCRGQWRNVAVAYFTTGDHQFKSACIRITNLFGSSFSSSLPPAWNKPDRSGGDGSHRELVPGFSRDIFLVATLLEVLGVYIDCRTGGGRRRIPSYTELRIRTKEWCYASMFNLQWSLALPCKLQL